MIEGTVATEVTFRHADGSRYGAVVSPSVADAGAKAFQALRGMGFGESEVRRALTHVHAGASEGVEAVVRRCLRLLTERRARAS